MRVDLVNLKQYAITFLLFSTELSVGEGDQVGVAA